MPQPRRWARLQRAGIAALLFGSALVVRALPWPLIFAGTSGAFPFGNDAYYHLRRIHYSIVNFPQLLSRDLYVAFPSGGEPIWTPAFDWSVAFIARGLIGTSDPFALERLLVWLPPVLGAATVVGLYGLSLRLVSKRVALLAAVILCILPSGFWYSQVGFIDHHVAVAAATTGLLATTTMLLRRLPESVSSRWQWSLGLGLALGLCILIWPGCLLHVAIVELGIWTRFLSSADSDTALHWGALFARAHIVAFAVVAPACLGNEWEVWGSFSPVVLSHFQPVAFAAGAGFFGLLWISWRTFGLPSSGGVRAMHFVAALGVILAVLFIGVPDLSAAIEQSWGWFAKREQFQASVGESAALFAHGLDRPQALFTRAVFLVPLIIGFWAWRERDRPEILFICAWGAILFAATLVQRRFMNTFSIAYALLLAVAIAHGFAVLSSRVKERGWPHIIALGICAPVLIFVFEPSLVSYGGYLEETARVLQGEKPRAPYQARLQRRREFVARWLERNTPATAGYLDASEQPEYGILAPWPFGHVLQYVAQRPAIQDNFGDDVGRENFDLARSYYASQDEEEALRLLEQVRARYVIVRHDDQEHTREQASLLERLDTSRGSTSKGGPALSHHRLILESLPLSHPPGEAPSLFKVYEIVAGARLRGRATAGAEVEARLTIRAKLSLPFEFVVKTRADTEGRYEFVLPYPTTAFSPNVAVEASYRLRSLGVERQCEISLAATRDGLEVAGPDFL